MTNDRTIADIFAWEAFDSRGTPTVAVELTLKGGARGTVVVPSGASTGTHEARELRDEDSRFNGRGVLRAVANAMGELAAAVKGIDALDQVGVDRALREAAGEPALERLGANAVLAISIATALAAADAQRLPLYVSAAREGESPVLPLPMVNIISGGAHAGKSIDIQDFLVVPLRAQSFREAIEIAWNVRAATAEVMDVSGYATSLVADEGGLGPVLPSNRDALELLADGIERAGYEAGVDAGIAIDVAATQLYVAGADRYDLSTEGRMMRARDLVTELRGWVDEFPVVSMEDVLAEDDWDNWSLAMKELGDTQIIGDDLFCTNQDRLRRGIESAAANAILVKPNQIGTLTDARRVIDLARTAGFATILSARSGETEDTWLADLAVGWATGQIKVGSTMRSERTAKWNRLLAIEARLGEDAHYAGAGALAAWRG